MFSLFVILLKRHVQTDERIKKFIFLAIERESVSSTTPTTGQEHKHEHEHEHEYEHERSAVRIIERGSYICP